MKVKQHINEAELHWLKLLFSWQSFHFLLCISVIPSLTSVCPGQRPASVGVSLLKSKVLGLKDTIIFEAEHLVFIVLILISVQFDFKSKIDEYKKGFL